MEYYTYFLRLYSSGLHSVCGHSPEGQEIIRRQGTVPYAEAMALVMKQLDQYEEAMEKGLYR